MEGENLPGGMLHIYRKWHQDEYLHRCRVKLRDRIVFSFPLSDLRLHLERMNFTEIIYKFYRNQFIFIEIE